MRAGSLRRPALSASVSRMARRGFTLIDMLIVMAIVALLLTIALPNYFASVDRSRELVLRENLRVLRITLDRFFADKGYFPDRLEDLVAQRYLRLVPVDPVTGSSQTWITIEARTVDGDDGGRAGIADVRSGAAGVARDGQAYATF